MGDDTAIRHALVREYEGLWRSVRAALMPGGRQGRVPDTDAAGRCFARMVEISREQAARYAAVPAEEYRTAMWERRLWLHESGQHGRVYDGADALLWKAAMARERPPCAPAGVV